MSAPPDKLSLVVFSGDFDKVHYALVMASAAAAVNTPVTVFLTMWAGRALVPADGDGPGWRHMPVSSREMTAAEMDAQFGDRGVARFEALLSACVALGVKFMVCEMGLRALGMAAADLRDDVPIAAGGVVTFLADASRDGAMVFI